MLVHPNYKDFANFSNATNKQTRNYPQIQPSQKLVGSVNLSYTQFDKPAIIYSLFPHAHFRGIETRFDIHMPDGKVEPLLHVPRYDFNWQHNYSLAEPIKVPAGSRLVHRSVYDNSAANPANPDATREVPWGLQSHDEMLYGGFFFRWENGTSKNPVHDELNFQIAQFYGALDDDFSGALTHNEMPP